MGSLIFVTSLTNHSILNQIGHEDFLTRYGFEEDFCSKNKPELHTIYAYPLVMP